jgi:hypothetical protein
MGSKNKDFPFLKNTYSKKNQGINLKNLLKKAPSVLPIEFFNHPTYC